MEWLKNFFRNFLSAFSAAKEVAPAPPPQIKSEHPWLDMALIDAESGLWKEIPGEKHNPLIVEALRISGLSRTHLKDETMWCGAYVNKRLKDEGITGLPASPAWAASWLKFGKRLPGFKRGAIACVPSKSANSGYHVTFADKLAGEILYCVGGNQGNTVRRQAYPSKGVVYLWPK